MLLRNITIPFLFAMTIMLVSPNMSEAADCKGLEHNKCSAKSDCTWVKSHKRKNGKTVKAHCRAKSKKGVKKKNRTNRKNNVKNINNKKDKKNKNNKKDKKNKRNKKNQKDKKAA